MAESLPKISCAPFMTVDICQLRPPQKIIRAGLMVAREIKSSVDSAFDAARQWQSSQ